MDYIYRYADNNNSPLVAQSVAGTISKLFYCFVTSSFNPKERTNTFFAHVQGTATLLK